MSEAGEVKRDGAKAQKNSGRGHYQKGDSILGPFTVDYKEYPNGIRVDKKLWTKICMDAFRNGNTSPSLKVTLGEGDNKTRLWIIDDSMFKEMLEAWEEKYDQYDR